METAASGRFCSDLVLSSSSTDDGGLSRLITSDVSFRSMAIDRISQEIERRRFIVANKEKLIHIIHYMGIYISISEYVHMVDVLLDGRYSELTSLHLRCVEIILCVYYKNKKK